MSEPRGRDQTIIGHDPFSGRDGRLDTVSGLGHARRQLPPIGWDTRPLRCAGHPTLRVPAVMRSQVRAVHRAVFSVNGGASQILKMQLVKGDEGWAVARTLEAEQVIAAHPLPGATRRNRPPWTLAPIAAAAFERDIYADAGWQQIVEPSLPRCGGAQGEQPVGYCELSFKRLATSDQDARCEAITYLFEKDASGKWVITRTLPSGNKFNIRTSAIEARDPARIWC